MISWQTPPESCSYLPHETASLVYRLTTRATAEECEALLERGWRRHGAFFFRPACPACVQCRSLRVPVAEFRPSKSQRRCWRRNADVRFELARPSVSREHLDLINRYHLDMHRRRGWPLRMWDESEYVSAFLVGDFDFAYELRYYQGSRLVGVGLIDVTPRCSSSAYFYHDPAWRPAAPGVYSMLVEIHMARRAGREFHYLGYWIEACGSMAYKSQYRPHELLMEQVDQRQTPRWQRVFPTA
jgi:arginine-tRNA-protein transferase